MFISLINYHYSRNIIFAQGQKIRSMESSECSWWQPYVRKIYSILKTLKPITKVRKGVVLAHYTTKKLWIPIYNIIKTELSNLFLCVYIFNDAITICGIWWVLLKSICKFKLVKWKDRFPLKVKNESILVAGKMETWQIFYNGRAFCRTALKCWWENIHTTSFWYSHFKVTMHCH